MIDYTNKRYFPITLNTNLLKKLPLITAIIFSVMWEISDHGRKEFIYTQKDLANFLDIHPATVSRSVSQLKKLKLIFTRMEFFHIDYRADYDSFFQNANCEVQIPDSWAFWSHAGFDDPANVHQYFGRRIIYSVNRDHLWL